jgi:hypothetical protein
LSTGRMWQTATRLHRSDFINCCLSMDMLGVSTSPQDAVPPQGGAARWQVSVLSSAAGCQHLLHQNASECFDVDFGLSITRVHFSLLAWMPSGQSLCSR